LNTFDGSEHHPFPIALVAARLGSKIAAARHGEGDLAPVAEKIISDYLADHNVIGADRVNPHELFIEVMKLAQNDEVYDSEEAQMARAFAPVLTRIFESNTIYGTGVVDGLRARTSSGRDVYLTQERCPRCGEYLAYDGALSSGVFCLDDEHCAYLFGY